MWRKAEKVLQDWKAQPKKKALLITGARQIGKTYLARKFGQAHYAEFVEFNFLTHPEHHDIFAGNLDGQTVTDKLTAYLRKTLPPGKTLIFLDEIQECPNARTAIKFLVEDGRFDYIESGSLLGVNYKHVPSFPIGSEQTLTMYPLDFEEFCRAAGVQQSTLDLLQESYTQAKPVDPAIHQEMLKLFKYYMVVGGMPEAVDAYRRGEDIGSVISIQQEILQQYQRDIRQYTIDNKRKVQELFDQIPTQLNNQNRHFTLAVINKNRRWREYEDALVWLINAGVALPCFNLTEPKIPLRVNEQRRLFKLFLNDTGLLCAMSAESVQFDILRGKVSLNLGCILENMFAQQLKANGFALRYLNKKNTGELDFVINQAAQVIPVEIKSGNSYYEHAALDKALQVKDWSLKQGLVFCSGNVQSKNKVLYLPWYMVMFLKPVSLKGVKFEKIALAQLQGNKTAKSHKVKISRSK